MSTCECRGFQRKIRQLMVFRVCFLSKWRFNWIVKYLHVHTHTHTHTENQCMDGVNELLSKSHQRQHILTLSLEQQKGELVMPGPLHILWIDAR